MPSNNSLEIIDTALILAGGFGTRLRSAVSDVPKPMAPIDGKPFLEYQIQYWMGQGIRRFVLSVGYMHEVIESYFGCSWGGASIEYVVEKEPLGTGGAMLLAAQEIEPDKRFLLLNGDTYFPIDLSLLSQFSVKVDSDWSLSLFKTDDINRYMGVALDQDDQITSFKDLKIHGQIFANGGVYLVHPRTLNELRPKFSGGSSLESDIFPAALSAKQRIYGLRSDAKFIDIGIPYDYQRASIFLEKR